MLGKTIGQRFFLVTLFCLRAIAACQTIQNSTVESTQSPDSSIAAQKQQVEQTNLLALFLVKRDNLKQEYRGEIYPIAFYSSLSKLFHTSTATH